MVAFVADENVSFPVVQTLRSDGHDVLFFGQRELKGTGDQAVLFRAGRERRIVISHNVGDFTLLHDAWQLWSREWGVIERHSGVLLIPVHYRLGTREIVRELSAFLAAALPITNELYTWRRPGGWVRRQA